MFDMCGKVRLTALLAFGQIRHAQSWLMKRLNATRREIILCLCVFVHGWICRINFIAGAYRCCFIFINQINSEAVRTFSDA